MKRLTGTLPHRPCRPVPCRAVRGACYAGHMSTWRILEWSRERGRGAISGLHFDRVEFDASHADVDDFVIGEAVHVELEGVGPSLRVRRIRPDLPRFCAPVGAREIALLDERLREGAEAAVAAANGWIDVRLVLCTTAIRLEVDNDRFAYGASGVLDLIGPTYVDVATARGAIHQARWPRNAELSGDAGGAERQ
jgi:hypothetical protein